MLRHDFSGHLGRGLTLLLALFIPFLSALEYLHVPSVGYIPVVTLLSFGITLTALIRILKQGSPLKRWAWLPVVLLVATGLSGINIHARGGDALFGVTEIWSFVLLASAVAVLYADQPLERAGVLVAMILAGVLASALGLGEFLGVGMAKSISDLFTPEPSTWSLLLRATGPLRDADSLAWMLAILLPVATAGVIALDGWRRDVAAFTVAVLWAGVLATYSLTAPLAAVAGMLIVLITNRSRLRSYSGVAVALLIVTVIAFFFPSLRIRWQSNAEPVNIIVQDLKQVNGGAGDDSLHLVLYNPGPSSWPSGFSVGYHVFYSDEEDGADLTLGGWVGEPLDRSVEAGGTEDITLPFRVERRIGFLTPDLKGPGGSLGARMGLPFLIVFRAAMTDGLLKIQALMPIQREQYLMAATEALIQKEGREPERSRREVWGDALSLLKGRPWFGLGPGAMETMVGYDTESLYLETAVDYGWVGLFALLVLFATLNVGLSYRNTLESLALSGALMAAAIDGIAVYVLNDIPLVVMGAVLIGIAWAAGFGPRSEDL